MAAGFLTAQWPIGHLDSIWYLWVYVLEGAPQAEQSFAVARLITENAIMQLRPNN